MVINGNLEFFALDGSLNAITNAFIEQLANDPTGATGRIYYNTTNDEYRYYDGTQWVAFGSTGSVAAVQDELDDTQASLGGFINTDGTFNPADLNSFGNITGLTGSDTLLDALSQLDTAITAAAGVDTLGELTDVTLGALAEQQLLSYDDTLDVWVNRTRDAAGVVTTDTTQAVSGSKTFSAATEFDSTVELAPGTAALPSVFFDGDTNSGLYQSAADEIGFAAGGNQVATLGDGTFGGLDVTQGSVRAELQFFAGEDADVANPGFAFTDNADTGLYAGGGEGGGIGLVQDGEGVLEWDETSEYWSVPTGTISAADYALAIDSVPSALANVQYVDDAITASTVATLDDVGNVTETGLADNDFLVYNGTNWVNENPSTARGSLSVYSIADADSTFVDVAGDTMTGDLVMSGAVISNDSGTAALPSYTFTGDLDTGMSAATADTLVLSAGGTAIVTVGTADVTLSQELLAPAGSAATPSLSFSTDPDSGMYSAGANSLGFAVNGSNVFTIEDNGTLNVAGTVDYETLVTDPDDIPNKQYVDDEISAANTSQVMNDHDDVIITGTPADNSFLVYDGATDNAWENLTPAAARTAMGMDAGQAGDIWVEKAGDAMTGNLDMGSNSIINVADPVNGTDAANKTYVDNLISGVEVRQAADVLADSNAIDSVGGTWTYNNGTSGVGATLTRTTNGAAGNIDGVASVLDERVLVTGRTNAEENGLYVLTAVGDGSNPSVLTRCGSCDEDDEIPSSFVWVQQGTTYGDTGWVASVADPTTFTVGTDDIDWLQFSGGGVVQGGVGLTLTGTTLDVNLGAGIVELPTDEVGIDLYDDTTGAIILTTDGSSRSTATGAQIHLLLDGTSLVQGASGLAVAASTFTGDTGSDTTVLPGETMNFIGGVGLTSEVAANGSDVDVTFDAVEATTAASQGAGTLGVAEFFSDDFTVTSGFVELNPTGVQESVSFTFGPITGDDITLTGTDDTLDIKSDTLTVNGDAADTPNPSITIDLNAVLSDLNDVNAGASDNTGGGEVQEPDTSARDRIANGYYTQDVLGTAATGTGPFTGNLPGYYGGISRGAQVLAWHAGDEEWIPIWSDSLLNASGLGAMNEWDANARFYNTTSFQTRTGGSWAQVTAANDAGAVFARWDENDNQWKNFTPAQMVTMLNAEGGLDANNQEFTLAGDTGTQTITTAPTATDTLTIAGGTGITTAAVATDQVTIDLDANIADLNDVVLTSPTNGEVLSYDGSDWINRSFHYVETFTAATSFNVNHGLGQQYVNVTVVDTNDEVIIPQTITMTDANNVDVDLSSSAAVTVIVTGIAGV